jgi:hypothetical protein
VKTKDVIIYVGLAGIAYFIYRKFKTSVDNAISTATQPVANAIVSLTSGPTAQSQLQGQVIMPDGTNFSTSQLQNLNFGFQGNVAQFTMNGVQYSLSPHDANGNYVATRV